MEFGEQKVIVHNVNTVGIAQASSESSAPYLFFKSPYVSESALGTQM